MDFNFDNIGVKKSTGYTPEQLEAIALSDEPVTYYDEDDSAIGELITATKNMGKPAVPIYELKADEDARAKLRNHKEQSDYEELVAKVKEWEGILADKGEIDHKALAVLLDDKVLFDELKRSHHVLDDTYAYITKETNKWEEHEAMYDALLGNIRDESEKCEEARQMLSKLM